jgi:hypothetical protein
MWYWLATRCSLGEDVCSFVVVAQHMMKFKPVELAFQLVYGLVVCRYLQINTIFLFHDLIHDKLSALHSNVSWNIVPIVMIPFEPGIFSLRYV